jgi:hypothetical protein
MAKLGGLGSDFTDPHGPLLPSEFFSSLQSHSVPFRSFHIAERYPGFALAYFPFPELSTTCCAR